MILIVDDKAENIYSLKTLLSLHGFPVDTASGGEEALKKVLTVSYALIILDVQMPGMDGFEVAETLSGYSRSKEIPIIFLTAANTDKKYITKGYSSGGVDYITKPIDPDILLLKVKTLYRLYEQSRELSEEIKHRKIAEQQAASKAAELRSILESIPQLAFTTTADGRLEYTNKKWLDYAPSALAFPHSHVEDKDMQTAMKQAMTKGEPLEMELRLQSNSGGNFRYHLLRLLPVREQESILRWAGTFTDIEDQKQIEKKKDEFMGIASHELKTPLSAIKAYVQLLERESAGKTPFSQYVHRTLAQVKKLDDLIAELLDVSKLENGKLVFDKQDFDFDALVEAQIEMFKQSFPDYHIEREGRIGTPVYGNAARLEQVLVNFLNNAIKYSPQSKRIILRTLIDDEDQLYVSVTDFGIGVPKEEQHQLFHKFYRAQQASSSFQGMGIGLYICAGIIQQHHGKYGIISEPGKGSTFYFYIPYKKL